MFAASQNESSTEVEDLNEMQMHPTIWILSPTLWTPLKNSISGIVPVSQWNISKSIFCLSWRIPLFLPPLQRRKLVLGEDQKVSSGPPSYPVPGLLLLATNQSMNHWSNQEHEKYFKVVVLVAISHKPGLTQNGKLDEWISAEKREIEKDGETKKQKKDKMQRPSILRDRRRGMYTIKKKPETGHGHIHPNAQ